jgi:hypothetical protein
VEIPQQLKSRMNIYTQVNKSMNISTMERGECFYTCNTVREGQGCGRYENETVDKDVTESHMSDFRMVPTMYKIVENEGINKDRLISELCELSGMVEKGYNIPESHPKVGVDTQEKGRVLEGDQRQL